LKRRLGCDKFIIHESDSHSGGLLLLWNKGVVVKQLNVSQYYIDAVVGEGGEWRLTRIYGEPSWDQKDQTWEAMRFLKTKIQTPCHGW
jgi:hypothetical protein